ncbi:hypothetical protein F5B20DRAFT_551558 [Whalleya microplaca]|nr:hypothetical protein F5B20DRAFT_551558 [Whalleya microplaca]
MFRCLLKIVNLSLLATAVVRAGSSPFNPIRHNLATIPAPDKVRAALDPAPSSSIYARCGSQFGKTPGTKVGVFTCAASLYQQKNGTVYTIGKDEAPRLICEDRGTKYWLSPYGTSQDNYTFSAQAVGAVALWGISDLCCRFSGDDVVSPDAWAIPCEGWGVIGEVEGRHDAIITANNDTSPEPMPCNQLNDCPS